MLEDILPTSYPYRIVQNSVASAENFQCEIRAKIDCEKDFLRWIKEFESNTNSSWILRNSVASSEKSRHRFSRNYLCQHSDYRKKKETLKNKKCSASLTVRIKRDSRSVRGRDSFAKDGYMSIIKINFMHSHKINVAEAWNWLPRSEETKKIFVDLFNTGMSPAAAKNYHEAMLLSESPESLANSRINPPVRWIYRIYQKWQEENLGGLNSGPSFKSQRLNYYTTTSLLNQCTSTAEKSRNAEAGQSDEASTETKTEDLSPKEKELLAENEKLLESVRTLDDKYKRALADNENVRIRMRREISDAKQYGIQSFVKDLLDVADVLGKATESVPKDALESNNHLKTLYEGLQMTEAQLQSVFKRYGVTQINPLGEKFNPNHHEALFEQEDASKEPGTVGTVTKIGYKLHERVVRPAMVGVIKGS